MTTVEQTLTTEAARLGLPDLRFEPLGALTRLYTPMDLGIYPARELARRLTLLPEGLSPRESLRAATATLAPLRGEWMALSGSGGLRFARGKPVELNLGSKTPEQAQLRAEDLLGAWLRVDAWRGQRVECRLVDRAGGYRFTYTPKVIAAPPRVEIVYLEDGRGWALPGSRTTLVSSPHRPLWSLLPDSDPTLPTSCQVLLAVGLGQEIRHMGYAWPAIPPHLKVEAITPFAVMPVRPPLGLWRRDPLRSAGVSGSP